MNIEIKQDCAFVEHNNLNFYYGYEQEFEGEWCFVVTKRNKEIYRVKTYDLDKDTTKPPEHYLILGMMRFISLKTII